MAEIDYHLISHHFKAGMKQLRESSTEHANSLMTTFCANILVLVTNVRLDRPRDRAYHYMLMNPNQEVAGKFEEVGIVLSSKIDGDKFQFTVQCDEINARFLIQLNYDHSLVPLISLGNRTIH